MQEEENEKQTYSHLQPACFFSKNKPSLNRKRKLFVFYVEGLSLHFALSIPPDWEGFSQIKR